MSTEHNMSPKGRNQVMVSLSEKALEEFELVARWSGLPLASLLRQVLETHHQSPTFGALVRRAREEEAKEAPE